jgi:hypothetical protein
LELHNGEDSRLTDTLINEGLRPALDVVEKEWRVSQAKWQGPSSKSQEGSGALIIVGKRDQDKFFSNGAFLNCPFAP